MRKLLRILIAYCICFTSKSNSAEFISAENDIKKNNYYRLMRAINQKELIKVKMIISSTIGKDIINFTPDIFNKLKPLEGAIQYYQMQQIEEYISNINNNLKELFEIILYLIDNGANTDFLKDGLLLTEYIKDQHRNKKLNYINLKKEPLVQLFVKEIREYKIIADWAFDVNILYLSPETSLFLIENFIENINKYLNKTFFFENLKKLYAYKKSIEIRIVLRKIIKLIEPYLDLNQLDEDEIEFLKETLFENNVANEILNAQQLFNH